jgi:serine protease Do
MSGKYSRMVMARHTLLSLVVAIVLAGSIDAGAAETKVITLHSGTQLRAQVLKQDDQVVILDLGFDVLRVPRSQVESIKDDVPAENKAAALVAESPESVLRRSVGLYRIANLTKTTTEQNVARFGEAVVMVTSPAGTGSGFLINKDGHLITNYHVIARETLIKTTVFQRTGNGFEQKKYEKVKIIAFNPFVDLALLRIDDAQREFPYVYLGDMSRVAVGETVFAIGNPLGLTRSVSQGIVSTTNRDFAGQLYIQTTTDINPGNSGGPLFNLAGEVIGVTSMGYLFYGGLNFAIPVDTVKRFLENCDAFAYSEDNPNAGFRYLQPSTRKNRAGPPAAKRPEIP